MARRPLRGLTEKQFQEAVLRLARMYGWRVYHTYDSRRSPPGFPDLTLVRRGRLLFLELKTARGKVSVAQRAWLDDLSAVPGAQVAVVRPRDLQLVADLLR